MRAPDVHPVDPRNLGRYAVAGILALALSLAGVMGGHQLLGAAFGTADPEEDFTNPAAAAPDPDCPPATAAADACDYDGTPARAGERRAACTGPRESSGGTPARATAETSPLGESER